MFFLTNISVAFKYKVCQLQLINEILKCIMLYYVCDNVCKHN